ncbi:trypco2 family protein [Arthrobacter sp. SAFR-044]|uniref:trypco2 family protein n=1 Tax=Arthrobacter sp. SAFR-044 TaxID=3387278 RepID=UPI003F7C57AE
MSDGNWPEGLIPLTSLVGALREELKQARESADPSMPFMVGPVSVEINVVVRYEAEAKFGAKLFAFLDAGISGKAGRDTGHKVSFVLTPRDPSRPDGDVVIHDSDDSSAGEPPPLGSSARRNIRRGEV